MGGTVSPRVEPFEVGPIPGPQWEIEPSAQLENQRESEEVGLLLMTSTLDGSHERLLGSFLTTSVVL